MMVPPLPTLSTARDSVKDDLRWINQQLSTMDINDRGIQHNFNELPTPYRLQVFQYFDLVAFGSAAMSKQFAEEIPVSLRSRSCH